MNAALHIASILQKTVAIRFTNKLLIALIVFEFEGMLILSFNTLLAYGTIIVFVVPYFLAK